MEIKEVTNREIELLYMLATLTGQPTSSMLCEIALDPDPRAGRSIKVNSTGEHLFVDRDQARRFCSEIISNPDRFSSPDKILEFIRSLDNAS